jgi:hypothetical protein
MPTYVISAHGESDYKSKTSIPANTSVQFYQRFGEEMQMDVGFHLQTALTHPGNESSGSILEKYPPKALWNGVPQARSQNPKIILTPDPNNKFKCGIVRAEPDYEVIHTIDEESTLTQALAIIRQDADTLQHAQAEVHCLFCL